MDTQDIMIFFQYENPLRNICYYSPYGSIFRIDYSVLIEEYNKSCKNI